MEAILLQFSGTFPTIFFETQSSHIIASAFLKFLSCSFRSQFDEAKNFIEANRNDHLNMIFNELIENVEQVKLKNRKKVILEISLDLKIYFIFIVYSYHMKKKSPILLSVVFFCSKIAKLYIAETFLRNCMHSVEQKYKL